MIQNSTLTAIKKNILKEFYDQFTELNDLQCPHLAAATHEIKEGQQTATLSSLSGLSGPSHMGASHVLDS